MPNHFAIYAFTAQSMLILHSWRHVLSEICLFHRQRCEKKQPTRRYEREFLWYCGTQSVPCGRAAWRHGTALVGSRSALVTNRFELVRRASSLPRNGRAGRVVGTRHVSCVCCVAGINLEQFCPPFARSAELRQELEAGSLWVL